MSVPLTFRTGLGILQHIMNSRQIIFTLISGAVLSASAFDKTKCRIPERFKDHPVFNTPHCSVNFGFLARRGYFARPDVIAECAKIRAAGANWVTLNTHFCQEAFYSRKMFLDFDWSSGEVELAGIVKELHGQGLHVLLKPCITLLDSAWMGRISFPDKDDQQIQGVKNTYWADWFASLRECLRYFAEFSERNGVEAIIIGAEYKGATCQGDEWRKTVAHVRKYFSGPLTYEFSDHEIANRDYTGIDPRKAANMEWFKDLDFLSLSTYPPAAPACPRELWPTHEPISLETMKKHLSMRRKFLTELSAHFDNMPIVFTEIGTRSARANVVEPWDFLTPSPRDAEEQANFMEAVFSVHADLPFWLGLSWWKWDETQHNRPHYSDDRSKDRGFIIDGKPACEVLKKWCRTL